jgi:hypothetical protein
MWALHYIYLPRINRDLAIFCQQWNNHPLRTKHHQTPLQLFVRTALELRHSSLTAMQDIFNAQIQARNEILIAGSPQNRLDNNGSENQVIVPAMQCSLSQDHLRVVKQQIDPLDDSKGPLGLELYLSLLDLLSQFGIL